MLKDFGYVRLASAVPKLKVADTLYNAQEIKKILIEADKKKISLIVFPELCITGYTCGDLFGQEVLLKSSEDAVCSLCDFSKDMDIIFVVGSPVRVEEYLFNCAIIIQGGKILGVVPKTYVPNYSEFYEKRWFTSGSNIDYSEIHYARQNVPFGTDLVFQDMDRSEYCIGVEVCEDLWAPIPPSTFLALSGASVLINLSASNEIVNKAEYRVSMVKGQSGKLSSAYVYASSGVHESTTDLVFSGHSIICENGAVLKESERFNRESSFIFCDVDLQRLIAERRRNLTFREAKEKFKKPVRSIAFKQSNCLGLADDDFIGYVEPHPFVPSSDEVMNNRCLDIFNIQVSGLAKRIEHTGLNKAIIGISGGLDSTLALLVALKTFEVLDLPRQNIHTITMPGFGTSGRTYNNTIRLCKALNTNLKEINIVDACLLHFKDINHDPEVYDVTYENVQARERTQILMDIANKEGGIVVGTGDLSEIALGWSTYNGDHMSMYAVNSGIPKTLVKYQVKWIANNKVSEDVKDILLDILDTPVSPELLPTHKGGEIAQKTEDHIGPYELHDFFLYHMVRYGAPPQKVIFLAKQAFGEKYSEGEIKKWLKLFYKRFFSQQFKRSCMPDGPKVGTICLSPRGDWRMPSDASVNAWIEQLEK
jgi:NAD+ synthase (glutamine-hydrolysing)